MKLLIIAGPYEADRIRKAAIAAGFETLAVEPGESLSGWITASRPDLIVMAPQIVHPDPALALAKVRTVPRGRVPVFLVGDAAEEERMRNLAEGFFVRPIAPELLLAQARAILTPAPAAARPQPDFERTEMGLGAGAPPRAAARPQPDFERTEMGLGAPVASPGLKPLVAPALAGLTPARGADPSRLLAELGAGIDALLDADLDAELAAFGAARPRSEAADFGGELTRKAKPDLTADAARAAQKKRAAAKKPGRTSPGMPVPAVAPPVTEDPRARLLRRHAVVQDADYFTVLGVARAASDEDVRRAHAAVLRETAALEGPLADELADQIADIRAVADEALRILTDARLRPRYAAHLPR
ncbi:MAG TPA: hypothetical protein VHM31_08055 [Polyangia bacterium]|nr:hypothetical protein [Polyangia bacterium]